ncbi:MAG: shikimate kinase [Rhodospirillum sp.]|nr:shikimate kinase [Rhodospirillum sp.]MCF8489136.1 shikimate kinase [Rhodospirillum sp.]MCF8502387.1 shikimate kinase [Rhodospirillum sp.]
MTRREDRSGQTLALTRPLVLVGLMGAGKTSIGRRLAQDLGVNFVDADTEIETAAQLSVNEIFATYGEDEFRALERRVMARLVSGAPQVVAAGGGAFMAEDTRTLIRERALSLWLRADLDLLLARTRGRHHRPLLNTPDPRAALVALAEKRYPIYATADMTVDTVDEGAEVTASRALEALADHLAHHPEIAPCAP